MQHKVNYHQHFLSLTEEKEFIDLKNILEKANDVPHQKEINNYNILLINLILTKDYKQYRTQLTQHKLNGITESDYLLFNKAVTHCRLGNPTEALKILSSISPKDLDTDTKFLLNCLNYHITYSLRSSIHTSNAIVESVKGDIAIPGSMRYNQSQVILMKEAIKTTIEDAISYGMDKELILNKVNQKYGISKEEAEKLYNAYVMIAV